jgi:hypothetical protein
LSYLYDAVGRPIFKSVGGDANMLRTFVVMGVMLRLPDVANERL